MLIEEIPLITYIHRIRRGWLKPERTQIIPCRLSEMKLIDIASSSYQNKRLMLINELFIN